MVARQAAGGTNVNLELEVFRSLFISIAEEMGIVLKRTAFSANIKERRDYSCALYDADGRTVAMGDHMPAHLGAMPASVKAVTDEVQPKPGEIYFLNDPFRGGTHLPDITSVSAIYFDDPSKPSFYLATRAHHADVGGMMPGSMPLATEIYQEGLRIPPIRLVRDGEYDPALLSMILSNVRTPDERLGDLGAQVAAHRVGERRLAEAVRRHGISQIAREMAVLQDYAEAVMRSRLESIPDCECDFTDWMDDDGFGSEPIAIRCQIAIRGSNATVDFRGSAPQARGGVNANHAVTTSAVMYCFRCLVEAETPYNAGILRPIEILTRPGSICDAQLPASTAAGNVETSQRIVDAVLGALRQALPGQLLAGSSGTMNNISFGGADPNSGRPFSYYETIAGGMGAWPGADGLSGVHTHMTNSLNTPIEAFERQYPVRIRRYSLRPGSGGNGTRRGGDGVVREYEFLTDATLAILSERRKRPPSGAEGGEAGRLGRNLLGGDEIPSKGNFDVASGDCLRVETPGGGGYFSSLKLPTNSASMPEAKKLRTADRGSLTSGSPNKLNEVL